VCACGSRCPSLTCISYTIEQLLQQYLEQLVADDDDDGKLAPPPSHSGTKQQHHSTIIDEIVLQQSLAHRIESIECYIDV